MTLSELILLIHWEIQKSYNFIEELSSSKQNSDSINIHMGMEKIDLTIPISFKERDLNYDSVNKLTEDIRFRKLFYPLVIQSDKDIKGRSKKITAKKRGKVLDIMVRSNQVDKSMDKTKTGQITISLLRRQT